MSKTTQVATYGRDLDTMATIAELDETPEKRHELMHKLDIPAEATVFMQRRALAGNYFRPVDDNEMDAYRRYFVGSVTGKKLEEATSIEDIPTEALTVLGKAKEKGVFDQIRYLVAASGEVLAVGRLVQEHRKAHFLLAQWGESLTSLESLTEEHQSALRRQRAKEAWKENTGVQMILAAMALFGVTWLTGWGWGVPLVMVLLLFAMPAQVSMAVQRKKSGKRLSRLDIATTLLIPIIGTSTFVWGVLEFDRRANIPITTDVLVCDVQTGSPGDRNYPTLKGDFWLYSPQGAFSVQPSKVDGVFYDTTEGVAAALKLGQSYRVTYHRMPIFGDVNYLSKAERLEGSLGKCS